MYSLGGVRNAFAGGENRSGGRTERGTQWQPLKPNSRSGNPRFTGEVFGGENLDVIDEYIAEDYVGHNPGGEDIHGREELKAFVKMYRSAVPDLEVTTEALFVEGAKTRQRNVFTGTHGGKLMGIPPTEESVDIEAMGISVWEDDHGIEHWSQVDRMGLMQQLGVA